MTRVMSVKQHTLTTNISKCVVRILNKLLPYFAFLWCYLGHARRRPAVEIPVVSTYQFARGVGTGAYKVRKDERKVQWMGG